MGLDKMDHIVAADVPRLLSAAPFAAGCELMPAPGRDGLFNQAAPVDLYDPATVAHFGWGAQNMATARRFWADLAAGGRAPGVEYVIVRSFLDGDGTGQSTIADVRWNGAAWVVERGPGDGAVPVWSCEAIGRPDVVLPGEHLGVLATQGFADQVFAPHIAPLVDLEFLAITASLKLQPLSRDVPAGGPARFAIVQDVAVAAGDLQGALIWTPLTATGALDPSRRPVRTEVSLQPMEAASVVTVTAPARPGVYRVVLQGAADGVKITGAPGATVIVAASARAAHPPPP